MNEILIVSTDGLGDMIMRLPFIKCAVRYSKKNNIKINFVLASKIEQSALENLIDFSDIEYNIYNCGGNQSKKFWLNFLRIGLAMRNKISDCYIIDGRDRNLMVLFFKLLNAKRYYGLINCKNKNSRIRKYLDNRFIDSSVICHKTLVSLEFCKFLKEKGKIEDIYCAVKEYIVKINDDKKHIIIAPSSGGQQWKLWPVKNYIKLVHDLLHKYPDIKISFIGAGNDKIALDFLSHEFNKVCMIYYNKPINQIRSLLYSSNLFISADCGALHLASTIQDLPIIGLFGPTNCMLTGPILDNVNIIKSNLECSPCFDHRVGKFECNNIICMKSITPEIVMRKIEEVLFNEQQTKIH